MTTPLPDILAKLRQEGPLRDAIERLRGFITFDDFCAREEPSPSIEAMKIVVAFVDELAAAQSESDAEKRSEIIRARAVQIARNP